jgi:iron complex outermembrane receptor protein
MTRPQLQNLSPGYTAISQGNQTLTRGNPDLNPMLANNLDLSFEWYPDKETLLSAGFFQKDIKSYIQTDGRGHALVGNRAARQPADQRQHAATPFTVTTQVNSPGGKLKGFELSAQRPFTFLPAPFDKFGAILNYTHVKSDIEYVIEPDLRRHAAGADRAGGAGHPAAGQPVARRLQRHALLRNGPFKARVSGSYRDAYLIQVAPSATNNNDVRIKEKTFNLDSQVSYEFDKFTVTLEGINLTDQEDSKVVDSDAHELGRVRALRPPVLSGPEVQVLGRISSPKRPKGAGENQRPSFLKLFGPLPGVAGKGPRCWRPRRSRSGALADRRPAAPGRRPGRP